MNNLSVSNWIQIAGIVSSLLVSIVSVSIAIKSLHQSRDAMQATATSTFNANRPYVSVYSNAIDTGLMSAHKYLVIKNFGKSVASVEYIRALAPLDSKHNDHKLASLDKRFSIAPGMSVKSVVDTGFSEVVPFEVKYQDLQGNTFKEKYDVNFAFKNDTRFAEANKPQLPEGYNELIAALNIIAQQIQD